MNKNTVIALILSFIVLIIWQILFRKNIVNQKRETNPPIFKGIKKVIPDYTNGYVKLIWDKAKDESEVTYGIFVNEDSKITDYSQPSYVTTSNYIIIDDLDLSKNYYFAVRAVDSFYNAESNTIQIFLKSKLKKLHRTEKVIKYETDLALYYFSTLGGSVKNIVLKKFKNLHNKENVNLLFYENKGDSFYYPLNISLLKDESDYNLLKYNEKASYTYRREKNKIIFTRFLSDGTRIVKTYIIERDKYYFKLLVEIKSQKKYKYFCLKWQPTLGPKNKLDKYDTLITSYYADDKKFDVKYKRKLLNKVIVKKRKNIEWVSLHNRYFIAAIIPEEKETVKRVFFYSDGKKQIAGVINTIFPQKNKSSYNFFFTIYAGPKLNETFTSVSILKTLKSTIYRRGLFFGKLTNSLGSLFLNILLFFHGLVKNYGIAIILFTILIKIVLYPLTHKQFESMVKMQKIQPIINQIKEQYKKEPQVMNKELMKVYRKYKVNPFGGCLPLLLQLPIFIAMWNMLQTAIELRSASFLWIRSLALPDTIGYVAGIPINPLVLIMGVTMFLQQGQTKSEATQKSMMYFMPFLFLILFWNMPSGVVLYWTVQNILGILQQYFIKKYKKVYLEGERK